MEAGGVYRQVLSLKIPYTGRKIMKLRWGLGCWWDDDETKASILAQSPLYGTLSHKMMRLDLLPIKTTPPLNTSFLQNVLRFSFHKDKF